MLDQDLRYQFFVRRIAENSIADWTSITQECQESLYNYLVYGFEPGGFLTGVLTNDLYRATLSADFENRKRILHYVRLMRDYFPAECFGSPGKMSRWRRRNNASRERILQDCRLLPNLFDVIKICAEESGA